MSHTAPSAPDSRSPRPAYLAEPDSPIYRDPSLIRRIRTATDSRHVIDSFILPPRSGRAFSVPAGCLCRISCTVGPQVNFGECCDYRLLYSYLNMADLWELKVADLNMWNLHNPRERFWAARTRQIHASHVTEGDRLWSCLPFLRPLCTITADSIGARGYGTDGMDEFGGRVHCLLGARCDPYINKLLTTKVNVSGDMVEEGQDYDFHCHSNLTRAIIPYGLSEADVHDVLNIFQVTGLDKKGRYFMQTCPAQAGDYFEFLAEIDILCALSTCPGGDLSQWGWGKEMEDCCRPLTIEIFRITDESVLNGWKSPQPATYRGLHGIKMPQGQVVE